MKIASSLVAMPESAGEVAAYLAVEHECLEHAFSTRCGNLDTGQMRLVECVNEDNVDMFRKYFLEESKHLNVNIFMNSLEPLSSYIAQRFPTSLTTAHIAHVTVLLSAHKILRLLLEEFDAENLWLSTAEGINVLHIAAATGDYIAIRCLLQRQDAPIKDQDYNKRSALHYAAETNVECMITILANNKHLLISPDVDDCIPLFFVREDVKDPRYMFLKVHTELYVDATDGSITDKESINLVKLRNAPLHLDAFLYPKPQQGGRIRFGEHERHQETFSEVPELNELIAARECGPILRPTCAFGQFETPFSPVVGQFMRIAECTEIQKLHALLFDLWQMNKPGLVLTFYGSDPFCPSLVKLLQKTLRQITRLTKTWVLTDGREKGVGDLLSQAIRGYAEAYGMQTLQVLTLLPWRRLYNSHALRSPDYLGKTQLAFPKRTSVADNRIQLAENHTHYLLVDSLESSKNLPLWRTQFEAYVGNLIGRLDDNLLNEAPKDMYPKQLNSEFRPPQWSTTGRIPLCGILVEGDRSHLQGISLALRQNIPFVVIANTGGLAKALDIFVSFMRNLLRDDPEGANQIKWSRCKYSLKSLMEQAKGVIHFESSDEHLLREVLERAFLLDFFSTDSQKASELDSRILRSLIKPELFEGADEEECWNFNIRIALSVNRTDFLPENMFARVDWNKKDMTQVVENCLMDNNTAFIQLLVDSGFPLHDYVHEDLMAQLYMRDFNSNVPRSQLFRHYVYNVLKIVPKKFTKSQIDRINNNIAGFQIGSKKSDMPAPMYRQIGFEMASDGGSGSDGEERLLRLLVWSFICRRFKLSNLIWNLMKDSIPAALLLVKYATRMKKHQQSHTESIELDRMSKFYEKCAVGILEECYAMDTKSTMAMLCMKRPLYANRSQLLLAEDSRSKHFIEHQACQTCIENVWNQHLSSSTRAPSRIMTIIAGMILPFLVPFVANYNYLDEGEFLTQDESRRIFENDEKEHLRPTYTERFKRYKRKLIDFYSAPRNRFAYGAITYMFMLGLFTYVLIFVETDTYFDPWRITLDAILLLAMLEHISRSIESRAVGGKYIANSWNQAVIVTMVLYGIGNIPYVDDHINSYDHLIFLSRLALALCLVAGTMPALYFFVTQPYIGPKFMMIRTMLRYDLAPFLCIIAAFWVTFTCVTIAMIYKPPTQSDMSLHISNILMVYRNTYFSMFGEFNMADNIADLENVEENCERFGSCIYPYASIVLPIIMFIYVLLTHVLLLNLLIAMFTKRYDKMETVSKQLWAMQRFGLVKSFESAPPMPFPWVMIWPFFLVGRLFLRLCEPRRNNDTSFAYEMNDDRRERQIINWQKFRALDYAHRNPHAFDLACAHPRLGGKVSKKTGFLKSALAGEFSNGGEEGIEVQQRNMGISVVGHQVSNAYIENRLQMLENKISAAMQKLTSEPKPKLSQIAVMEKPDGSVSHLSESKKFDSFRMARFQDSTMKTSAFNYDRHKVAFFRNPQDDNTPHSLSNLVPWDEDLENYEPLTVEQTDKSIPQWNPNEPRDMYSGDSKPEKPQPPEITTELFNPTGRTGITGRGLLPSWGVNPAVVIIFTLEEANSYFKPEALADESILQRVLLRSCPQRKHQFPWFLCKHTSNCDTVECLQSLMVAYMHTLAMEASDVNTEQISVFRQIVEQLESCRVRLVHLGTLADRINSDNAWIDITAINVRIPPTFLFSEAMPLLYSNPASEATWVRLDQLPPIKSSHFNCLSYFQEVLLRPNDQSPWPSQ